MQSVVNCILYTLKPVRKHSVQQVKGACWVINTILVETFNLVMRPSFCPVWVMFIRLWRIHHLTREGLSRQLTRVWDPFGDITTIPGSLTS